METASKPVEPTKAIEVRKPQDETLPAQPRKAEDVLALYAGASVKPFPKEIADVLAEPFNEDEIEVKPHNGVIYLPGIFFRNRLNKAFGPGGWSMLPRGPRQMKDNKMFREYALYCLGRFVAEAVGDQDFIPTNKDMSEADAAEGCKTNAIQRCCKDLGIASQIHEPAFIQRYKAEKLVAVNTTSHSTPVQWRRKDRPAITDKHGAVIETGPASETAKLPPPNVPAPTPRPTATVAPRSPVATPNGPVISDAQSKRFYAIAKSAGKDDGRMKEYCLVKYGNPDSRHMPKAIYEEACKWAADQGTNYAPPADWEPGQDSEGSVTDPL